MSLNEFNSILNCLFVTVVVGILIGVKGSLCWYQDINIKNIWIQFQLVLNAYPLRFHWQKRMVIHLDLKGCPPSFGQRSLHPAKKGIVIKITHGGLQIGSMWMTVRTNLNIDPSIQGFFVQCCLAMFHYFSSKVKWIWETKEMRWNKDKENKWKLIRNFETIKYDLCNK